MRLPQSETFECRVLRARLWIVFGLRDGEGGVVGGVRSWRWGSEFGVEVVVLDDEVEGVSVLVGEG